MLVISSVTSRSGLDSGVFWESHMTDQPVGKAKLHKCNELCSRAGVRLCHTALSVRGATGARTSGARLLLLRLSQFT